MSKLTLLTAAAAGYVLGARAGRGRYEQIATQARKVANNPRVQSAASTARDTASQQAVAAAAVAKDKVVDAASAAKDKIGGDPTQTGITATP